MNKILTIENGIEYTVYIHSNGYQNWHLNGKCHRLNGPALTYSYGHQEWWYHGEKVFVKSQAEFEQWLKLQAFE